MKYIETIELDDDNLTVTTAGDTVYEHFDTKEEAKIRYEELVTDWSEYLNN